ncbi:uncharacterized protein LOC134537816 [Bacillus rossius redtenbacheri]|uniref:uncharacterized protein LOC134537816 n=1 Tax=Bacillus rossius redtenbacheri TaxID=93214 RepID=UPI002FDC9397
MACSAKPARVVLKRAAKARAQEAIAVDASEAVVSAWEQAKRIKANREDNEEQKKEKKDLQAENVPLYAKTAAYGLMIPCGINFLNIEEDTKWDPDLSQDESDTDPLSIGEVAVKKEPVVKEEVAMPVLRDQFPEETQASSFVKTKASSFGTCVGTFSGLDFLREHETLGSASDMYNMSLDSKNIFMHFLEHSEEDSPCYVYSDVSQEFEQGSDFVTSDSFKQESDYVISESFKEESDFVTIESVKQESKDDGGCVSKDDDDELFSCAFCSANFHHRRTIAAHLKTHETHS